MTLKLLYPFIGFVAGIFLAEEFSLGLFLPAISFSSAFLCWIATYIVSKNPIGALRYSFLNTLWITMLFVALGSLDFELRGRSYTERDIEGKPLVYNGYIEDLNYLTSGDRFKVSIKNITDTTGKTLHCRNLKLLLYTDGYQGENGELISFTAIVKNVDNNRFNESFKNRLKHENIPYSANVNFSNISRIGKKNSFFQRCEDWRKELIILIENSALGQDTGNFLISILLGEKSFLSQNARHTLNSAGLAHILALSGMHVAIMLTLLLALLFPFSMAGLYKTRKVLAILLLWVYVILTGASPSTVRAAIMASFVIGAYLIERKNYPFNSLIAAILIILFYQPYWLWDVGLQLSFICVASILLLKDKFNPIDHHSHPYLFKTIDAVLITLITTFSTWILIAFYFGTVPLMFLPANLFLLPLLPVLIGFGILFITLISLGISSIHLAKALDLFYNLYLNFAGLISLPERSIVSLNPPLISVFLWMTGIVCLVFFIYSIKRKNQLISLSSCGVLFLFSIIGMLLNRDRANNILSFPHSFTKIEVKHNSRSISFPRNTVAEISHENFHILSIDSKLSTDTVNLPENSKVKERFLIIGPKADISQMGTLIKKNYFSKIILHSGVGKNKKLELLALLEDNFDNIYSLRETGSVAFDL